MKSNTRTILQALAQARGNKNPLDQALIDFDKDGGTTGKTHSNLFKSARSLHYYGVTASNATSWLWSKYQNLYPNDFHQVELAVNKFYDKSYKIPPVKKELNQITSPRKLDINKLTHEDITKNIDQVISLNTPTFIDKPMIHHHPDDILRPLYGQKALICIGNSVYDFSTKTLEEHGFAFNRSQFVVANPMRKKLGKTQSDKVSERCKDNACILPKVLVFECDIVQGFENQAKIIFFLAKIFPLIVVHSSGNKSLHAWFKAPSAAKDIAKAKELFVSLGADPAALRESQLVRMPNAYRDNGNHQVMFYYAPHHLWEEIENNLFSEYHKKFVSKKGESNNV